VEPSPSHTQFPLACLRPTLILEPAVLGRPFLSTSSFSGKSIRRKALGRTEKEVEVQLDAKASYPEMGLPWCHDAKHGSL
jgi:hypothetical protein